MAHVQARAKQLQERLVELQVRLNLIEHQLDEPMPQDFEDRASEREEDEVLEDLGVAGQQEIRLIEAALKRIEHGTYGVCAECGEEISDARLEAVPYAVLCRECAL